MKRLAALGMLSAGVNLFANTGTPRLWIDAPIRDREYIDTPKPISKRKARRDRGKK